MKYTPLTEKQLKRTLCIGPAQFEVIEAKDKESKSGLPMLELKLRVWDSEGTQGLLSDYILDNEAFGWKLNNFLKSIGKGELYQSGEVIPQFLAGHSGSCRLKMQKSKDPQYEDRIGVGDYIVSDTPKPSEASHDADVPF